MIKGRYVHVSLAALVAGSGELRNDDVRVPREALELRESPMSPVKAPFVPDR